MIEDDPDVAALAQRVLPGLQVYGDLAAYRAADMAPPRLIVLDLELPDGQGLDVLKEIRGRHATKDTPVVVFTGTDIDPIEGQRRGANAWVRKPREADELERALRAIGDFWLGLNRTVSPP